MKIIDRIISNIVSPPTFGLDISDFTAKFVKINRRGRFATVEFFGEAILPSGVVVDGEIKKEDELTSFLKQNLISSGGERHIGRFVTATLPEEKGFVHIVELPRMSWEEAGKAARWELEGVVPLPVEKLYFDYAVLPSHDSAEHMDLLVTAFPKQIVDSYVRVLKGIGLVPAFLELESQAISRALWKSDGGASLFVDIGAVRTSFITVIGGFLFSTRSISAINGFRFNKAIAEHLGVSEEEARRLKVEVGFSREYKDGVMFEALLPQISALGDELKREVLFFKDHPRYRHGMALDISSVVLCGGEANLINLADHLSIVLKKNVEVGDPFGWMRGQKYFHPPFPRSESLKYTTAIGAALRNIKGFV